MTPTLHKTPLNPKPPAGTKLRVGHSKLSAREDHAQRQPLAGPPANWAERITLSTAWLQRANPLASNSPILRTIPKILEPDGHYPPLGGQLHVSAAQPPPANIPMKMRKAPTACRTRRAAARPVLHSARSLGRKIFTKTTCANHPPLGGQLHVSAAQPPPPQHSNEAAQSAYHCAGQLLCRRLAAVRHTSGCAAGNGRQSSRTSNRERAIRISRKR